MCGITGFISNKTDPNASALLGRMNASLIHRGPDDEGFMLRPGPHAASSSVNDPAGPQVGLAMRRLSIIDLATGHQPIANEDESCWIVFNGEIYNHRELRHELEAKGHCFRTNADTEAILHAYEEYGTECVRRLRGMFAFAIWDERQERLFLARDPVGIKPLYWTQTGDTLLFASEIKALLVHPEVRREVDEVALNDYLTYLYVPPPRTMFAGISKLPPGHRLLWQRGAVTIEKYWVGPESLLGEASTDEVAPAEVWSAIRESVQAHLLSDVPLGAFFSSGLDSLAVVAAMEEVSRERVRTFTVGFEHGGLYNEVDGARAAASFLKTQHRELMIGPECIQDLPEIVRMLGEPMADASVLPNYAVAGMARQEVKVVLTGTGGDELFGGYQRYRGEALAARWRHLPDFVRRSVLLPALRYLPKSGNTAFGERTRLAVKFLEPLHLSREQRYLAWNSHFDEPSKTAASVNGFHTLRPSWEVSLPHFHQVRHRPFVDQAMYVDLKTYLPGDPLMLSDRMTMAHSLEGRVPFVDQRLMEFAYGIPASQKIHGGITKAIVREALKGRVPPALLSRPKRGFGTPTDVWLRGPWRSLAERVLSKESLRRSGCFDPSYIRQLFDAHQSGGRELSQHLWALMVFQLWHQLYIESPQPPSGRLSLNDLGLSDTSAVHSAWPRATEAPAAGAK